MLYSKAIAANSDVFTSQAFVFLGNLPTQTVPVTLSILIASSGEDIFIKVRQTGLKSEEVFFSGDDKDIPARIQEVVKTINEEIGQAAFLDVLVAACQENAIYLQNLGATKAFLLREGRTIDLTAVSKGQLISGFLKPEDRLLFLASEIAAQQLREEDFKDLAHDLLASPRDSLEDSLEGFIQAEAKPSPISAVLLDNTNEKRSPAAATSNPKKIPFDLIKSLPKKAAVLMLRNKKVGIITLILGALMVLIAVGIIFKISQDSSKKHQLKAELSGIEKTFAEALSLKDSDPQKAREKLQQSYDKLNSLLSVYPDDAQARSLKERINQNSSQVLKIFKVEQWPVFLNLDLIKKGFSSEKMAYYRGDLLLVDTKSKSVVVLDTLTKSPQIVGGAANLGDVRAGSLNAEFIFTYSKDKGVGRVDTLTRKSMVAAKPDPKWGSIVDIVGFAGNFYLLDAFEKQVWKYVPVEGGYSDKFNYLESPVTSLYDGVRMQIDGSVWVLTSDPALLKFTSGRLDNFNLTGLDKNLKESKSFFVSSDTEYLYYLDPKNSRLVVLEKSGKYYSQYTGDKFATASDFVVDEKQKKIYLLESNNIYHLDLK